MFKNYIKTSIRILIRQKAYSIINILGLSIGITASILILLYITHELSYDKFHKNASIIDNCLTILHNKLKTGIEIFKDYHDSSIIIKGNSGKMHQIFIV